MIEKEVKLLDVPYSQLTQALCGVGATKIAVREIHDRYCDTPTGTLADQGVRVRVRQEGDIVVITTKSKVSKAVAKEKNKHMKKYPAKIRKEDDTHVGSLAEARSVIGVMGLQVVREKHKIRHSWKLDEKSVCDIDFYDGLPPVVEIESLRSKDIYKWIKRLGLSSYRVTTRGSQKLFRHYASRLAS